MVRLLKVVEPFLQLLPEVEIPERKLPFRDRCLWTMAIVFIFMVGCQMPIYGAEKAKSSDAVFFMSGLMTSNHGSLMELGISPMITSGLVFRLLAGNRMIDMNHNIKKDRLLFQGAQKFFALLFTLIHAIMYVMAGMYGPISTIGSGNYILIIFQLFMGGYVLLMMDEVMSKGYGFGSGLSLYIVISACRNIIWYSFSPMTSSIGNGKEREGAVVAFFHLIGSRSDKLRAIYDAFCRDHLPNLSQFIITIIVFGLVVYVQQFRLDLPIISHKYRGSAANYPIKLLYTSNMPLIFKTTLISNLYFISKMFYSYFPNNFLIQLLGCWDDEVTNKPTWGLVWLITSPKGLWGALTSPHQTLCYVVFTLLSCTWFAMTWIEISGSSPKDVTRQFSAQNIAFKGYRESGTLSVLRKYIPLAGGVGGLFVGCLTIVADVFGALGGGTAILLAVTMVFQYYEMFAKEGVRPQNMMMMGE
jgi:protein transport protein SEC61 subunit alpha